MFDCYNPYEVELRSFGAHWCGPVAYQHGTDQLVARYECAAGGDGQTTEVYCFPMPTRFYTIKALPGPNSMGKQQDGFEVTTGSGQARMAAMISEAISRGMLGWRAAVREDER